MAHQIPADPQRRERTILVGVLLPEARHDEEDPLEELRGLAESARITVVAAMLQKRQRIDIRTYIGSGKVEELKELVQAHEADVVLFDNNLGPAQIKNLEQALGVKVIDRTELILDIFASRAQTHEAHLQIELAQLEYALPRLKRMWTHLSRYKGGIGVRGPGEKQLEEDRRLVTKRIGELKLKLRKIEARKEREVMQRDDFPTVSLVGYTNAGKSSLMNALTRASVLVQDQLFATLDTRTRRWSFQGGGYARLSDTVGFIKNLPHTLVASFKATLEEARQADLLLHVVDASSPELEQQIEAVHEVLREIELDHRPMLMVLNKVDRLAEPAQLRLLESRYPDAITVSALKKTGLDQLESTVRDRLHIDSLDVWVQISNGNDRAMSFLIKHAQIKEKQFHEDKVLVRCKLPRHGIAYLEEHGAAVRQIEEIDLEASPELLPIEAEVATDDADRRS
jgi:GTP-binding protein HflX